MLKNMISATAIGGSAMMMMAAAPALADPISISGNVIVSKGIQLNCSINGSGNSSAPGTGTLNSLALSGSAGLCNSLSFTGLPYTVNASGGTLTIVGVTVTGITGNCAGNLVGSYNSTTGVVTYANATLPTTTGGSDCVVNGSATLTPPI